MHIEDVLQRIQGEFAEMPGLCLTAAQAQKLWGMEREFCEKLLEALVAGGIRSYRGALERLTTVHVDVPPAVVANVNSPGDLR